MRIAIDLRSLSSGSITGVENYVINLLDSILPLDKKNTYTLFYNSWSDKPLPEFNYVNSQIKLTKIPNKILNLGFKINALSLEKIIGDFDCLFLPNLSQYCIQKKHKLVITVHDLSPVVYPEYYNFKRRIWHKFLNYSRAFARADIILSVSKYTKLDLIRLFNLPEEKIKVVYPGIDSKIFNENVSLGELRSARNQYGLPGDYILFLSTIEPRKNLEGLIKAFEQVKHPLSLVIAGRRGWKHKLIFKLINASRKRNNIRYLGYIDEKHKPAIIKLANAVIYPSFYEGFGFVPLEAMLMKVPTIVANVSSLPEVVRNGALLISPYNLTGLARCIEEICGNYRLRNQLIEKGLVISKNFVWSKAGEQFLQIVNNLS